MQNFGVDAVVLRSYGQIFIPCAFPMRGRPVLCGILLAHAVVVFTPQQPTLFTWTWIGTGLIALAALCRVVGRNVVWPAWRDRIETLAWVLLAISLALGLAAQRVWLRLDDALAPDHVDRVARVTLRVAELPQLAPDSRRFRAQVLSAHPAGVPQHIMVSWFAPDRRGPFTTAQSWPFPEILPGQVWRMALNLRPPAGERNPHAFDVEGHLFAQGIRAVGRVRGTPVLLRDEPWADLGVVAQRLRHRVRAAMQPYVAQQRYGAVLTALAIGDQAGVVAGDWQVFHRSGITHLVSISGSHITMLAVLGGVGARWAWKRLRWRRRWLAERAPAQLVGAWAALLVAWLYCLLAGWGVPAQRTFWMLAVLALAYTARLPLIASRILLLAAVVVVLFDPWALMASGFWLSFGAVAVLMASRVWVGQFDPSMSEGGPGHWRRIGQRLWCAARLQLAITLALMPLLARLFHEISLVSPFANAYAIPIVGLVITPLSLLLALLACIPGADACAQIVAWLAHALLAGMMQPTQWLAAFPAASVTVPAVPWPLTLLAVLGMAWALLPETQGWVRRSPQWSRGFVKRHWGGVLLLPALLWRPEQPASGDWRLTVLDTGQSGAALLQTRTHTLLFDTGKRSSPDGESGSRTIVPFLRSQGIRQLDTMIVSHADLDHVGGASGVLRSVSVRQAFSAFDLPAWLRHEAHLLGRPQDVAPMPQEIRTCLAGQHWEVDGVTFTFLWPPPGTPADRSTQKNATSCVLLVRGVHHAVLFTGDIGAAQERALHANGLGASTPVDVVLAPHHGSRFSSSSAFVAATHPTHVIAQAGLFNPFGHPHLQTIRRWQRAGAQVWRTDLDGAVQVQSIQGKLTVHTARVHWPRYWQLPCHVRLAHQPRQNADHCTESGNHRAP